MCHVLLSRSRVGEAAAVRHMNLVHRIISTADILPSKCGDRDTKLPDINSEGILAIWLHPNRLMHPGLSLYKLVLIPNGYRWGKNSEVNY